MEMLHDAKELIREHKQDGVSDSEIDELCDEIIALLTSSLDFFAALLKFPATDNDMQNAEVTKNRLMDLIQKSNVLTAL